jgi:hypothetical protein
MRAGRSQQTARLQLAVCGRDDLHEAVFCGKRQRGKTKFNDLAIREEKYVEIMQHHRRQHKNLEVPGHR